MGAVRKLPFKKGVLPQVENFENYWCIMISGSTCYQIRYRVQEIVKWFTVKKKYYSSSEFHKSTLFYYIHLTFQPSFCAYGKKKK
jgi:hypothetical protein